MLQNDFCLLVDTRKVQPEVPQEEMTSWQNMAKLHKNSSETSQSSAIKVCHAVGVPIAAKALERLWKSINVCSGPPQPNVGPKCRQEAVTTTHHPKIGVAA